MDNHTKETRSYNMSKIQSKNSKPEEFVRKFLFSKGYRYRKNVKKLPGCPDIVLAKYKTIIFVNGCFWHMHDGCSRFVLPASNVGYWKNKLLKNKMRDAINIDKLKKLGWHVIVIWECQLRKNEREKNLTLLCNEIKKR